MLKTREWGWHCNSIRISFKAPTTITTGASASALPVQSAFNNTAVVHSSVLWAIAGWPTTSDTHSRRAADQALKAPHVHTKRHANYHHYTLCLQNIPFTPAALCTYHLWCLLGFVAVQRNRTVNPHMQCACRAGRSGRPHNFITNLQLHNEDNAMSQSCRSYNDHAVMYNKVWKQSLWHGNT